jgi:L,D-peptidoglycan transpeptidase YkuD (ErfK/YbiS/YcfS/YnhG family)
MFFAVIIVVFLSIVTPLSNKHNSHSSNFNQKVSAKAEKYLRTTKDLIVVDIATQKLRLFKNGELQKTYTISTSKKGPGQHSGSRKTPIGLHRICEKIGNDAPNYAIFKGRKFTGSIWPSNTPRHIHLKDYIVTRILRLEGLEDGVNKGQNKKGTLVDSKERAIYIHGTTMEWKLGYPSTIGCIHMRSKDIIKLFSEVPVGTLVLITT